MKKLLLLLLLTLGFIGSANAVCNCKGYSGPGGACYDGPGGPAYDGPGGAAYSGPGGPAYDGPGGPCYDGPGGLCYDGPGGGWNCPAVCSLTSGNSSSYSNTNTNNSYFNNNSNSYQPTTNSSFDQGYREGAAFGEALGILFNAFFGSN